MKRVLAMIFLILIFTPIVLSTVSQCFETETDVTLGGYFDRVEKPTFSFRTFFDRTFSENYTRWYESSFSPRGVIVRTYNTICYHLFHDSNSNILGKNEVIFEKEYILDELCITDQYDCSVPETKETVERLARELEQLREKLQTHGTELLVCITPNKAHYYRDSIPYRFRIQAGADGVRGVDCLLPLLEASGVPYVHCCDYADEVEYPLFYTGGIHWSRPFEQLCINRVFARAGELIGKEKRLISLGAAIASEEPIDRDADLYELGSIWGRGTGETFYEFWEAAGTAEHYEPINFIIQGGSFADYLQRDNMAFYPDDEILRIFYNEWYTDDGGLHSEDRHVIDGDYDRVPLDKTLGRTDCVIIEINESKITQGNLFVTYFNDFLESYAPQETAFPTAEVIADETRLALPDETLRGIWVDGWTGRSVMARLQDGQIFQKGLRVDFWVSPDLISANADVGVNVYVNGYRMFDEPFRYEKSDYYSILVPPEKLPAVGNDLCAVLISVDGFFVPSEFGFYQDDRELGLRMNYIGRAA